ncbi:SprT family zinc-dependent metalloprotease [Gallaecimonas sp. GXIMD4217]|uniref:SprT family zinc-dependent metalloprotease n=1 Tax=Gallaecimonas sp. GXIMD4217 TaxID=3131927 RepID=UPI00311AF150
MQQLIEAVEAAFARAEAHFGKPFPRPAVTLDLRGRAAGQAHHGKGQLRFNASLYRENRAAFLQEVVPHEVVHWLVWHHHDTRCRPHGREWQAMMSQVFGLAPRRTHDFAVREDSFAYRCLCMEHRLTVRRHNKVQRGQAQYRCKGCGATLVPA